MKSKTNKIGNPISLGTSSGSRPPIVVILGHIDHGKTTLLSKIKEMDLTKKEHGGITQHLGAYQVKIPNLDAQSPTITFIDTPGHAAFNNLRARGAKVADLAILVVAANEGVKPQTLESLKFINQAGLNYLVALNKVDLPEFNLEKAKMNLAENGVLIEGYGGEIVVVPLSAKNGQGVKELLEMILLLAEMMSLKGDDKAELEAVVIESKIDSHRGPSATVLVRNGSLYLGDEIKSENVFGRVKAMFNEYGENITSVFPGQPAEILGFKTVPPVGGLIVKTKGEVTSDKPLFKTELTSDNSQEETEEKKLKMPYEELEKWAFNLVTKKIEEIVYYNKPTKAIYIAIDGVAGASKSNQQRQRRFKNATNPNTNPYNFDPNSYYIIFEG
jgi:translation initiation factor IF-2